MGSLRRKNLRRRRHLRRAMTVGISIGEYVEEALQIQNHFMMKMNKKMIYQV